MTTLDEGGLHTWITERVTVTYEIRASTVNVHDDLGFESFP